MAESKTETTVVQVYMTPSQKKELEWFVSMTDPTGSVSGMVRRAAMEKVHAFKRQMNQN